MPDEPKPKEKTPWERSLELVGPCVSIVCHDRCEMFAYHSTMDSFRICVCGHTQQAHSRGATP